MVNMNRRKILKRAVKTKLVSKKDSSESDNYSSDIESDNSSLRLLEILLSLQKRPKQKKTSNKCKRRPICNDMNNGTCCFHSNGSRCSSTKKKEKRNKYGSRKISNSIINLESDDEKSNENVGDSHLKNIENKIDSFFKSSNLVSDDDDNVELSQKERGVGGGEDVIHQKPKDFYMIISDSDDESAIEKPSTSADSTIPGASDICNISRGSNIADKNKDELMDLVDSILLPEDDQLQKVSKPDDSWEDYKKKTEEMLGNVAVLIHGLKENDIKPEETVLNKKPFSKEVSSSCPICFESLGEIEAVATFCGHMFCKACITRVSKTAKKCPTCRKTLNLKKIHPVYF